MKRSWNICLQLWLSLPRVLRGHRPVMGERRLSCLASDTGNMYWTLGICGPITQRLCCLFKRWTTLLGKTMLPVRVVGRGELCCYVLCNHSVVELWCSCSTWDNPTLAVRVGREDRASQLALRRNTHM